jgi:4-azaleucine resistance transporter AzlC
MEEALPLSPARWPALAREALRLTLPIVLGFAPVGFAYGVLAIKAGLSPLNTLLMSLIVFAGSAQLIAVGMLAAGAPVLAVAATALVVNLRHLLMSAAVAPFLRAWPRPLLALFTFQMTDETFALHLSRFSRGDRGRGLTLAINALAHAAWLGGSALGVLSGSFIGDVRPLGLDFALPAMFIALLCGQVQGRTHLVVALAAAGLSLALPHLGLGQWSVLAATALAATLGLGVGSWTRK